METEAVSLHEHPGRTGETAPSCPFEYRAVAQRLGTAQRSWRPSRDRARDGADAALAHGAYRQRNHDRRMEPEAVAAGRPRRTALQPIRSREDARRGEVASRCRRAGPLACACGSVESYPPHRHQSRNRRRVTFAWITDPVSAPGSLKTTGVLQPLPYGRGSVPGGAQNRERQRAENLFTRSRH